MRRKARPPRLPRDARDPTGLDALERRALRECRRRMRRVTRAWQDVLAQIPKAPAVNQKYAYRLDPSALAVWLDMAGVATDAVLLEGGLSDLWLLRNYVEVAYARGTAQEHANLSYQSPAYAANAPTITDVLRSAEYRRRVGYLAAREWEEMQGLSGGVKADMTRILTDGMARGRGPLDIARDLAERTPVNTRRAEKIARTEMGTALRRARMDEADEAEDGLGLVSMQLHFSALSPTTRAHHAARHGRLYTTEQQRDWWSESGNSINCKCTTITVLVDDDGKPLDPNIQARARRMLEKYEE